MTIYFFKGEHFFLSNFYEHPVSVFGLTFRNNEAAFQSQKCPERAREFCNLTASQAKSLGRRVKLRPDWEEVKNKIMYKVCEVKFSDPVLREKLLNTTPFNLIEGNTWGDMYWGQVFISDEWVGRNKLGKILMSIRETLIEGKEI